MTIHYTDYRGVVGPNDEAMRAYSIKTQVIQRNIKI